MTDTEHRPTGSRVARIVPYAERKPLYAAYQAAREWAEKNGQSYTDDGIIQAAVKAYETEEIARLRAVVEAAKAWRAQFDKPADSKPPRMRALIAAVDALGRQVFPAETAGRVWAVPAEPGMERVRDRHGRVWVRSEYDKAPPMWWLGEPGDAIPHTWHELLGGYGPLTEVVPAEVVNA